MKDEFNDAAVLQSADAVDRLASFLPNFSHTSFLSFFLRDGRK